jgi:hypothetical protein
MHVHLILDKIIFPIYFDGTSKQDYRDAMYVLNITVSQSRSYKLSVKMKERNLI